MFRDSIGLYYTIYSTFTYNKNRKKGTKVIKIYDNGHRIEYIEWN
jgi:hypothetical protein